MCTRPSAFTLCSTLLSSRMASVMVWRSVSSPGVRELIDMSTRPPSTPFFCAVESRNVPSRSLVISADALMTYGSPFWL